MNYNKLFHNSYFFNHNLTNRQITTLRMSGLIVVLTGVTLASFSLGSFAKSSLPPLTSSDRIIPVEVITARQVSSVLVERQFTGVLVAARASELSFDGNGKILSVIVDEGDYVEPGQPLAKLDRRHLLAHQAQLQANRSEAAAILAELEAGPRKEKIITSQAEIRELVAQHSLLQTDYKRNQKLLEKKAITQGEFDHTFFSLQAAQARVDAAQSRLNELVAGTRVEKITAASAKVTRFDAELRELAVDLEDTVLFAPFAGRIAKRHVDEGTIIATGSPVFRLVEVARLEAWIGLPAAIASELEVGDSYQIVIHGATYSATIARVSPELNLTTRTRNVILIIEEEASSALVPGQVVRVALPTKLDEQGYWVPSASLSRSSRGLWSVMIAVKHEAGHKLESRVVEAIYFDGERVLIRGTVTPGEQVLASGSHRVVAGQVVKLVEN